MPADQLRVLRSTPVEGCEVTAGGGDGKHRYELKRKGLIRTTRADNKGKSCAYLTEFGGEVLAAVAQQALRSEAA
jgi:hypothetical protein